MMSISRFTVVLILAFVATGFCIEEVGLADESTTTSQPAGNTVSIAQIAAEREQVAKDLAAAKAALDTATADGAEAPAHLQREAELLGEIDLQLGQILAALEQTAELRTSLDQQKNDLDNLRARGPVETAPYTFALLETLGAELITEEARAESRVDVIELASSALKAANEQAEEKERARRKAKEALDTNTDDAKRPELSWALRRAELESRSAQNDRRLRTIELSNQKLDSEIHELRLTFLNEKLAVVKQNTHFTREGLEEFLARLDETEYRINRQLEYAKGDLALRDSQWVEARRLARSNTSVRAARACVRRKTWTSLCRTVRFSKRT